LLSDDAYQKLRRKRQSLVKNPQFATLDSSPGTERARAVAELLLSSHVYGYDKAIGIALVPARGHRVTQVDQVDETSKALSEFQADMDAIGGVVNMCTDPADEGEPESAGRNISAGESTTIDTLIELVQIAHTYLAAPERPSCSVNISEVKADTPHELYTSFEHGAQQLQHSINTRSSDAVLCQTWQEALGGALVRESPHPHGNSPNNEISMKHEVLQFAGAVRVKM
jgi:hypothetical protein